MWFKQVQVFQLSSLPNIEKLAEKLEPLAFASCLPSMPQSIGWAPPIDDENNLLVRTLNGNSMFCLQIEEKILPATVIRQELAELIKQIETSENRKLRAKEKYSLKDEILISLLPRAFTRLTRVHAYIDTKNQWLVLSTTNAKKTDQFLSLLKKCISEDVYRIDVNNISATMTNWIKNQDYPKTFGIEKAGVLQDAKEESRVIRCKQQSLFAESIQALLNDGCDVVQLALSWQDRVNFTLSNDFSLSAIQFQDEVLDQVKEMEPETLQQQFDADFLIMAEIFSIMLSELRDTFTAKKANIVDLKPAETAPTAVNH